MNDDADVKDTLGFFLQLGSYFLGHQGLAMLMLRCENIATSLKRHQAWQKMSCQTITRVSQTYLEEKTNYDQNCQLLTSFSLQTFSFVKHNNKYSRLVFLCNE